MNRSAALAKVCQCALEQSATAPAVGRLCCRAVSRTARISGGTCAAGATVAGTAPAIRVRLHQACARAAIAPAVAVPGYHHRTVRPDYRGPEYDHVEVCLCVEMSQVRAGIHQQTIQ